MAAARADDVAAGLFADPAIEVTAGSRWQPDICPMASAPHQATSSGQGTIVDLTVRIAIASATARLTPSSSNG